MNKLIYSCPKCNKQFKYKSKLNEHLNIKTPCNKQKEDLKCDLCNITFDRQYHKNKHEKTQKHILKYNINNSTINNSFNKTIFNIKNIININGLNKFVETDITSIDFHKINNILSSFNINNEINNLKEEINDLSYDDNVYFSKIFIVCLINIFKEINFNKENPQNDNCRILAFLNTTNNLITMQYLILDKDLENLFYWNKITYEEFLNSLLKLLTLVSEQLNNDNLTYIMNYLNNYFKNDNNLYNEIEEEVKKNIGSIIKLYKSAQNNINYEKEIDIFIKNNTKLPNGKETYVNF